MRPPPSPSTRRSSRRGSWVSSPLVEADPWHAALTEGAPLGRASIDAERVRETAERLVGEHHLPSLGIALVTNAGTEVIACVGDADIESGRELTPELRHRIGSITKTMVGLCTMALAEEGKLGLDDKIVERLPDIRLDGHAETLTVRHLLTHTGGIGEAPTAEALLDEHAALWERRAEDVPAVSDAYPDGVLVEVLPGTKWAYANHGWALLGEVVARAEGRPIEEVLRRRIFEPLGMGNSDLLDRPHADLTTGYHRPPGEDARELIERAGRTVPAENAVDGHNIRGEYLFVRGRAAGAVQAPLLELARYAQALLRRGEGIVSEKTFASMLEPQWCPEPRLDHIGLAFFREWYCGRLGFGHNGGVLGGWNTCMKVFPEDDLAVVVQLNLAYDDFARMEETVISDALGVGPGALPEMTLDRGILRAAPGVFEARDGRLTNSRISSSTGRIQISERDGGLVLHARRGPWRRGVRMLPADAGDPRLFRLETDDVEPRLVALVTDAGAVTGLRYDRLVDLVRTDSVEPWI